MHIHSFQVKYFHYESRIIDMRKSCSANNQFQLSNITRYKRLSTMVNLYQHHKHILHNI